jgi:hypothetical protein
MTLRGIRRSFGIALKLYPTMDENHENLLQTANVFLVDDLGGTTASHIIEVELTNAPQVTGFNRGNEIPILLKEGLVFELVDRMDIRRSTKKMFEMRSWPTSSTRVTPSLNVQSALIYPYLIEVKDQGSKPAAPMVETKTQDKGAGRESVSRPLSLSTTWSNPADNYLGRSARPV